MAEARFLVLEGVDGVGKSTQIRALATWLKEQGRDVMTCRDPGSTGLSEAIRDILLHTTSEVHRNAEMLLYMAARAQLVAERIRPALSAGQTVVCDRYLLSNVVYQGYAGGLELDSIWQVGQVATQGLLPDLAIVLDLPEELARARRGPRQDRVEGQGPSYLERVRQGFLDLAQQGCPFPVRVVDASAGPDVVHAMIRDLVQPLLSTGPEGGM